MANQDWADIGNTISNAVQDAIDSEDFSKLSQSIQAIVSAAASTAVDSVARSVNNAAENVARGMNNASESLNRTADSMMKRQGAKTQAQNPWKSSGKFEKKAVDYVMTRDIPKNELYSTGGASRAGGYLLTIFGAIGCFGFGLGMSIPTIVFLFGTNVPPSAIWVQAPFLIISLVMLGKGLSLLGRIRRFKNYVRALGTRTCISIQELASSVNKNDGYVLKDIRGMIERGMFRQGHLDLTGKSLFVTNQGYEAYIQDHQRMEEKKVAELAQKAADEKAKSAYKNSAVLSDDVKKLIAEGQQYISRIHACNEVIKDEVITEKLDALEAVSTKIFQYVEQYPESAAETKKLMKYYLPTTIKLLESYEKLNGQPVQGPNIMKSKKEIEDTLDTLNQAFARLFDNLYQDISIDITSDISVLNTMLAQEGLTGKTI